MTEMMANLTIGKKNYADAEAMMKQNLHKASDLRMRFIEDIDRDSDAYNLVISAYKLPKETEEEKEYRTGKIQEATKIASLVPMEVAERASGMLGIIAETVKSGNKMQLPMVVWLCWHVAPLFWAHCLTYALT